MRAMDRLKDEGIIKHIGVSNFTVERMEEAQHVSKHPIVANQVHYNVAVREAERKGVIAHCQSHDMIAIAWRPIRDIPTLESEPLIRELCERYGKTPVQVALSWLVSQQNVVTLTKTSSAVHLDENLEDIDRLMEEDDIERLRREFSKQVDVSDAVPLM